jgi:hypothetical protein
MSNNKRCGGNYDEAFQSDCDVCNFNDCMYRKDNLPLSWLITAIVGCLLVITVTIIHNYIST